MRSAQAPGFDEEIAERAAVYFLAMDRLLLPLSKDGQSVTMLMGD